MHPPISSCLPGPLPPCTATGRSGTHHATRALSQKRFRVIHEGAGPDGSVGWPYAVYTRHRRYIFEGPVEKIGNQRFVIVGHQVRYTARRGPACAQAPPFPDVASP